MAAIGVTRDADDSEAGALQSIQDALTRAGLTVPGSAGIVVDGPPRVGVFVLPGGGNSGMLESLCMDSVRGDPATSCLDEYFDCLLKKGHPLPANMHKARVHAWLASRSVPDRRLGEAAAAGDWPWDDAAFGALRRFLLDLFSDPPRGVDPTT